MVITILAAVLSSLLYLYISYILLNRLRSTNASAGTWPRNRFLGYALLAATLQLISFSSSLLSDNLIMLSLGTSLSLITWIAVMALLSTSLKLSTENLGIFIFPLAALTVIPTLFEQAESELSISLGSHILLSISAYSILGLAAAQAILYSIQERKFQQRKLTTLFKALPPLQVMEKTMIQFIVIGFVILTLSLVTGAYFLDNLFAQQLVHKTFFAILAWLTYGIFLVGHYQFGWRGQTATKFTIWAYFLLIVSYIGTELILVYIL